MGVIGTAFGSPKMITKADLGWNKIAGSTYGEWKTNDYENAYPSITKINNKFMMIRPYAVNGKGEHIEQPTAVINALYHPNKLNSSVEFREALSLMYLVHPKTHILVWRKEGGLIVPGGKITPTNIAGFSFMEGVTTITVGGKTTYTVASENGTATYTDAEVITLRGLNPYKINSGGFSATQAACKWTTIDDYIAQYQKGFFKNGAVPSGEFVISVRTTTEFNDIVDRMQEKHRGADNNNNVIYTHRPIDPATGKSESADIEWIPFAVSNRELSLDALFKQSNQKIDSMFGVAASIRGVGENNNYATARTDQQNFMENVVDPIALKIWTGFTHELNRITGGLGVAISYDIEIPAIADEEKTQQERDQIKDNRVQAWLDKGYSLASIKAYLESGDLEDLEASEVVDNSHDDPDVDDGDEVKNAPDPSAKGEAKRTNPKASADPSIDRELVPYELDIEAALNAQIDRQVDRAIATLEPTDEAATDEEDDDLTAEILAILALLYAMRGSKAYNEGLAMALAAGVSIDGTGNFTGDLEGYRDELAGYVQGFNEDTGKNITKTIAVAVAAGLAIEAIKAELRAFKGTQAFRVNRFARNESWRASEAAGLSAMVQLDDELNAKAPVGVYKVWNIEPDACPICYPLQDERVLVSDSFSQGEPPIHVACRCHITYEIIKGTNEMEMHCAKCDRFLGMTNRQEITDKIKCSNSKCRALATPVVNVPVSAYSQ